MKDIHRISYNEKRFSSLFLSLHQWAGKTIALGTFPSAEADEKCARAKALTRAWRSTMRPKPSRDWVMLELERLGVRVVSGRLGRKAGEDEEEEVVEKKVIGMCVSLFETVDETCGILTRLLCDCLCT